jgi:hypothetical protein
MKLELKHLAAYLPYNLQLLFEKSGRIITMMSCYVNDGSLHIVDYNEGNDYDLRVWNFKPLLHPLSDLTKEIEVNGEKFISIEELLHEINSLVVGGEKYSKEEMLSMCNNSYYSEAWITDRLTEWHFDIFGLIDTGLAVDINSPAY